MSVCCTEPECSWRERRVKVQLGADASVQAGDDVTLKENAVYSVLDTSGSAAVAADTGVDIDPVRARASHWTATFDPCIVYAHVGACSLQRGTCMCCALSLSAQLGDYSLTARIRAWSEFDACSDTFSVRGYVLGTAGCGAPSYDWGVTTNDGKYKLSACAATNYGKHTPSASSCASQYCLPGREAMRGEVTLRT